MFPKHFYLTSIAVYVSNNSSSWSRAENRIYALQAVMAQVVLVAFLMLVMYFRPYIRAVDNHLQMLSLVGAALRAFLRCRLSLLKLCLRKQEALTIKGPLLLLCAWCTSHFIVQLNFITHCLAHASLANTSVFNT